MKLRRLAKQLAAVLLLGLSGGSGAPAQAQFSAQKSLYAQSVRRLLAQRFASKQAVSYLLLDAGSGAVLASHWPDAEAPIALGSLVKPFSALAYARAHQFHFPEYTCTGARDGCWFPRGHGREGITKAIADSCNAYFRKLAANIAGNDLNETARQFGVESPPAELSAEGRIGVGGEWKIAPLHMARAYVELAARRQQPAIANIINGMRASAQRGTAAEVGRKLRRSSVLAKTGTAPCTHRPHAPGDGFVVALLPAESPAIVLLLRVHGIPGAKAAITAGRMLRLLEDESSIAD